MSQKEENRSASPPSAIRTERYMGFRTHRYRPPLTTNRGGSTGASVPLPRRPKSQMHHSKPPTPMINTGKPIHRAAPSSSIPPVCVDIHNGTQSNTLPGRTSVKNTDRSHNTANILASGSQQHVKTHRTAGTRDKRRCADLCAEAISSGRRSVRAFGRRRRQAVARRGGGRRSEERRFPQAAPRKSVRAVTDVSLLAY